MPLRYRFIRDVRKVNKEPKANFPERPKLRHITKEAHVLTENELFNLSSKRES